MNQSVTLFPQQELIGFQEQLECITPMISFSKCALAGVVKPTIWVYVLQVLLLDLRSAWTFFRRAVLPWPPKFSSSTTTSWPYTRRVSKTGWITIYQSNSFHLPAADALDGKTTARFRYSNGFRGSLPGRRYRASTPPSEVHVRMERWTRLTFRLCIMPDLLGSITFALSPRPRRENTDFFFFFF